MAIYTSRYSHGGATLDNWIAVAGTATGAGRPISVYGSVSNCAMFVTLSTGTANVTIQASGGDLDTTGNPPADSWVDQSPGGAGWDIDASDPLTFLAKSIPATRAPLWRTYINSISGGGAVTSVIPFINVMDSDGVVTQHPASYPSVSSQIRTS